MINIRTSDKKKVLIRAPLLSISGYGVHCRQIFKWLMSREDFDVRAQVVPWGNTSWMIGPDLESGMIEKIMSLTSNHESHPDISFQVQLPDEWDTSIASFNIGVSAVVETDKCNPDWIEHINKMDCVIVPSSHVKNIVLATGNVTTKLVVVPEWYIDEIDNDEVVDIDFGFNTSFNFLTIAQFTGNDPENDRKNLYYTVKWFCESFKDDEDVGLILKVNHGRGTTIDREITKNKVRQLVSEVRQGSFPKIHIIHGNLTSHEISSLYKQDHVKCLLSLTRGEGFGLTLLEAAAAEVPVVATNWSAHLDFLSLGKFIPINYDLVELPESRIDNRIFFKGMRWANPQEEDFKRKIVKLRNKYSMPKQWATELSSNIRSEFSSSAISLKYDNLMKEILEK